MKTATQIACRTCDQLVALPVLMENQQASCPRCHSFLTRIKPNGLEYGLANSVAALVLLLITISFPLLDIQVQGLSNSVSLMGSATALIDRGDVPLGAMVFVFVVVMPALMLTALISLFAGLILQIQSKAWFWITRCFYFMNDWNMIEVYLVGLFVTLIKLAALARVDLQLAFWSLLLFSFFFLAAINSVDRFQLWLQVKGLSQR